jgi:hypothetical protein
VAAGGEPTIVLARAPADGAAPRPPVVVAANIGLDAVAWGPGEYAVAWDDPASGAIGFLRVAADGSPIGPTATLAAAAHEASEPVIVWGGRTYLAAWRDVAEPGEGPGPQELFASRAAVCR